MRRKIHIETASTKDGKLYVHTKEDISNLQAVGQVIVDSEAFAFVYLLEDTESYAYVYLEESVWPVLKDGLEKQQEVILQSEKGAVELSNFHEELEYLISNIEGNGNYGEEMVSKVETVFINN